MLVNRSSTLHAPRKLGGCRGAWDHVSEIGEEIRPPKALFFEVLFVEAYQHLLCESTVYGGIGHSDKVKAKDFELNAKQNKTSDCCRKFQTICKLRINGIAISPSSIQSISDGG